MVVRRHAGERRSERERGDSGLTVKEERGRLQSERRQGEGGDKGGEGDLCVRHGSHGVLLCVALIEQLSQALVSCGCKSGPHGERYRQRWH